MCTEQCNYIRKVYDTSPGECSFQVCILEHMCDRHPGAHTRKEKIHQKKYLNTLHTVRSPQVIICNAISSNKLLACTPLPQVHTFVCSFIISGTVPTMFSTFPWCTDVTLTAVNIKSENILRHFDEYRIRNT